MPPRTGPRSKRRPKIGAPRHFTIIREDAPTLAIAHRVELDDGSLVLRDHNDTIIWIVARGEWCEIRPTTMDDIPYPEETDNAPGSGATDERIDNPAVTSGTTLTNENEPAIPPEPRIVEFDTVRAPIREEEARFVPSSPEEAQRILMEIERRLAPDYQDPPDSPAVTSGSASDAPPQTPIRPKE